jgi:hypothetical protein
MSEYQYYEFQAIDRPLTEEERSEIGSWSSRTNPTSTQAIFTYSYSDFPKSPEKVVEKYFDAMLYVANWRTKRLMFRLPRIIVDEEMLIQYCFSETVTITTTNDYIILDIHFYDEEGGGYWVEGEGWLSSLIMLRNDILNGDYRMLYLAWLNAIHLEYDIEDDYDELEPPIPDNLQNLSASLKSFIEFFEINRELISVASERSATVSGKSKLDIKKAVTKLTEEERIDFLVRVARGEHHINLQLLKRLQELSAENRIKTAQNIQRRTIGELLRSTQKLSEKRKEEAKQRAEQERIRRLEELAKQENELWEKVTILIDQKQAKAYEEAVKTLLQLRELSEYLKQTDQFQSMIDQIHKNYSRLSGLRSRLNRVGLTEGIIQ